MRFLQHDGVFVALLGDGEKLTCAQDFLDRMAEASCAGDCSAIVIERECLPEPRDSSI